MPTEVWIVTSLGSDWDWQDKTILGVFSTAASARDFRDATRYANTKRGLSFEVEGPFTLDVWKNI